MFPGDISSSPVMDESVNPSGSRNHDRFLPSGWLQHRCSQLAGRCKYSRIQQDSNPFLMFKVIKAFCNSSVQSRYGSVLDRGSLDFLWSTIVAIFLVGGTVGSLGGSFFADKAGRKGALIVSSVIGAVAGILFFASKVANSVEMLIGGRLLVGISSGFDTHTSRHCYNDDFIRFDN
jgi:hypothetical protein